MKHKLIYLSLMFLFLLGACQDEWDKHYLLDGNEGDDNATATIWEVILENPDYSAFVAQAKNSGVDSILRKEQQMTLWLPDNESMVMLEGMSAEEQKAVLQNHINYVALKANRFTDGQQVKTLAGKNIYLAGTMGTWTIAGQNSPLMLLCAVTV